MTARHESLPVALLYTGGTFGMVPSERGYTPSHDLPERVERQVSGLRAAGMPAVAWLDARTGPPRNSADADPAFWYRLADTIRAAAASYRGFVIIHGTDTLAFTGAALSFLLADIERPVIVTGARAPLGEPGSDAGDNLLGAVRAAAAPLDRAEVGILAGDRLLRANRTTKRHGDLEQAFTSPGCEPLARVAAGVEPRAGAGRELPHEAPPAGPFAPAGVRVGMLPVFPGIDGAMVRALVATGLQGLVLEAYPAAVGPGGDADLVAALAEARAAGVVIGAVSQARLGRIRFGRYAAGTPLADAGVVGGADMTREAALTKLHYLLAAGLAPTAAADAFARNLRGELTPE